ncbi:MAG: metallophosphoesterase [Deinococcota bacterium]|nr:metallophosphoesterase [Deinococcota bacterium]MDQ3460154.1 metallophosphoesterase [Deinococcota bacterium]
MRLAILTDVHYGLDDPTKRGSAGLRLLETVVNEVNRRQPDMMIDLGDRINDQGDESDRKHLQELQAQLERVTVPRMHLLGNHDVTHLSLETSEAILGSELRHRSLDVKGWHLVFWYADVSYERGLGNLSLSPVDLAWLEADLKMATLPSIVFSHVPLGDGAMVGNYYFEHRTESRAGYRNAHLARAIIERSDKVVMAVAGHVHWNALNTVDGVHYLTLQSLTETFTTPPHPAAAWAELELSDRIAWQVHGLEPLAFTLPLKKPGAHWLAYGGKANPVSQDRIAEQLLKEQLIEKG